MLGLAPRRYVQRRLFSTTSRLRSQEEQSKEENNVTEDYARLPDEPKDSPGFEAVKQAIAPFQGRKAADGSIKGIPFGSKEYNERVRFIRESADVALFEWMISKNHESRNLVEITRTLQETFPAKALEDSGVNGGQRLVTRREKTQAALENHRKALEEGRQHVLDLPHQEPPELLSDPFKRFRDDMAKKSASQLKVEARDAETNLKQDWVTFQDRLNKIVGDLDMQFPGLRQRLQRVALEQRSTSTFDDMDEPVDVNQETQGSSSDHMDDASTEKPTAVPILKSTEKPTERPSRRGGYKVLSKEPAPTVKPADKMSSRGGFRIPLKEPASPAMTLAQMMQRVTEKKK